MNPEPRVAIEPAFEWPRALPAAAFFASIAEGGTAPPLPPLSSLPLPSLSLPSLWLDSDPGPLLSPLSLSLHRPDSDIRAVSLLHEIQCVLIPIPILKRKNQPKKVVLPVLNSPGLGGVPARRPLMFPSVCPSVTLLFGFRLDNNNERRFRAGQLSAATRPWGA